MLKFASHGNLPSGNKKCWKHNRSVTQTDGNLVFLNQRMLET